jgi:hypothetical protein
LAIAVPAGSVSIYTGRKNIRFRLAEWQAARKRQNIVKIITCFWSYNLQRKSQYSNDPLPTDLVSVYVQIERPGALQG